MIGTDVWANSDDMFGAFLTGVDPESFSGFELNLYRHHRFLRLIEEEGAAA